MNNRIATGQTEMHSIMGGREKVCACTHRIYIYALTHSDPELSAQLTTVDDRANIDIMINKFHDDRYAPRPVQSTQRMRMIVICNYVSITLIDLKKNYMSK